MTTSPPSRHVAVVGSGPAGMFAVQHLLTAPQVARIDVFERIPAPFGLVRYGVAPDHPHTKSVTRVFSRLLESDSVRFFGNVEIGRDVSTEQLLESYDAVLFATGAASSRRLGIPGEEAPGCVAAAELVRWYGGHPDATRDVLDTTAESVAVVGAGNVALDVVRMLAKQATSLAATDVPAAVLDALGRSRIRDVHVLIRGVPATTKFTYAQLRELDDLDEVDVTVRGGEFDLNFSGASRSTVDTVRLFQKWSDQRSVGKRRQIIFHFGCRPTELVLNSDGRVSGVAVSRSTPVDADSGTIPVQTVIPAIGYRVHAPAGLPFDESSGTVPNRRGRVHDTAGDGAERRYVAGWIKRGPTGVIGTNRPDAIETVQTLVDDFAEQPDRGWHGRAVIDDVLRSRDVVYIDHCGWKRLQAHEAELGAARGAAAVKVATLGEMLAASRQPTSTGPTEGPAPQIAVLPNAHKKIGV